MGDEQRRHHELSPFAPICVRGEPALPGGLKSPPGVRRPPGSEADRRTDRGAAPLGRPARAGLGEEGRQAGNLWAFGEGFPILNLSLSPFYYPREEVVVFFAVKLWCFLR